MTQEPTTDSELPDRETVSYGKWICRRVTLLVCLFVFYLLLTGPLLWSYSKIDNKTWKKFVSISMTPIIKLEIYEKRDYQASLIEARNFDGCVFVDPLEDSWWLSAMNSYWRLYGDNASTTYDLMSAIALHFG